ncbi:MAG: ribonuclease P protein component [Prevotella sp.]
MTKKTNPLSPRLKSKTLIDNLFSGKDTTHITAYPVRAIIQEIAGATGGTPPIQVLFSVSKRHFKHAVQRNRVKRQMREIYRLSIAPQLTSHLMTEGKHIAMALIWLADRQYTTADLSRRMSRITERIMTPQEAPGRETATAAERQQTPTAP